MQTNLRDFTGESIYVGIDSHLKSWNITIMPEEMELRNFTQEPDSKRLALNDLLGSSTKLNPLNIIDDPELNRTCRLPMLVKTFENDLGIYFSMLRERNENITIDEVIELTVYYTIDLLIEYRDKALHNLPTSIIADVKNQILQAAQNNADIFDRQEIINKMFSQIDQKIWERNIVSETHNYMKQLQK